EVRCAVREGNYNGDGTRGLGRRLRAPHQGGSDGDGRKERAHVTPPAAAEAPTRALRPHRTRICVSRQNGSPPPGPALQQRSRTRVVSIDRIALDLRQPGRTCRISTFHPPAQTV